MKASARCLSLAVAGCLRELDAEVLGLGGLTIDGTMDSAVGAARPWWARWSGHDSIERPPSCPDLTFFINQVP